MAQRLFKIAKELNVGTVTIVEYLNNNGFEIENKPTSKVTDEMYNVLLEKYSNSMAVKEKADKMVIGSRIAEKEEMTPIVPPKPATPTPPPAPVEEVKKEEEAPEPILKKKEEELIKADVPKKELKVLGTIDLTPKKKAPKKVAPKKKKEAPKKEVKKKEAEEVSAKAEKAPADPRQLSTAPPEELIKHNAPTLQGLKVLGKIDAKKLEKPKPKP